MFWNKKKLAEIKTHRVEKISQLENARLERDGDWIELRILLADNVDWYSVEYSFPKAVSKRQVAFALTSVAHSLHMEINEEQGQTPV